MTNFYNNLLISRFAGFTRTHQISGFYKASHRELTFQKILNSLIDMQLKIVTVRLQLSTSWTVPFEIYFLFHANINLLKVNLLSSSEPTDSFNGLSGWVMSYDMFWQLHLPTKKEKEATPPAREHYYGNIKATGCCWQLSLWFLL